MLKHYVAVALRNLRASPLASTMNVVTLALGIACFVIAYAFVLFVYVMLVAYLFIKLLGADVIGDARAKTPKAPRGRRALVAKGDTP